MKYWQMFWTISLIVAGISFAFITVVVTIRGYKDLREMFGRLSRRRDSNSE
ncbi:MAG: hypothetical protein ACJ74G_10245 [Blastocatellia bacterium]|jgi:hypothetical protein